MRKDEKKALVDRVLSYCDNNGISRAKLAENVGVHQTTISWWSNGRALPTEKNCDALAEWISKTKRVNVCNDIDVDAIIARCDEIGLATDTFLTIMGKDVKWLSEIRRNGIEIEDLKKVTTVLNVEKENLYKKAPPTNIEDEIRKLKAENVRLKEIIMENKAEHEKAIAGCKTLIGEIVGVLYKELGIKVGK